MSFYRARYRPLLTAPSRVTRGCVAWSFFLGAGALVACGGDIVTLGAGDPVPGFGDAGRRVRNVNVDASEEYGVTLTDDLLEIFFISNRGGGVGGKDVWHARRASRTDYFEPPSALIEVSSTFEEASPAISADGLTLWVASAQQPGLGGMDIWRSTRPDRGAPFGAMENVEALNSEADDLPRPVGQGGSILPIVSNRVDATFQTFFARRAGLGLDFVAPEPLTELWQVGTTMEDAFLTSDGLFVFFKRAAPGQSGDLFVSWRMSELEPFVEPIPLGAVNSEGDERDPFVSSDRIRFFFSSNRREASDLDIYATNIDLPRFE
jgi:WD40 repeat protein